MLSGVGIVCFAASYAVAFVLELTRLLFRSAIRGAIMVGFAGAGLLAHTLFLYYRAVRFRGVPLSSEHDWYLLAAWVLVAVYLYLTYYHPQTAFGLLLLPLVLGLVGTAAFLADPEPFAREPASQIWGLIHAGSILLAVVAVLVGFTAGVMYLQQVRRLKHKLPPARGLRLPSLEWLQRTNSRAIVISVLMLGLGVVSGTILNLIRSPQETGGLPWDDPIVLSTLVMFAWLLVSAVLGSFYKPGREGRRVAYLTLVSFVFLVVALGVGLLVRTRHGGKQAGAMIESRIAREVAASVVRTADPTATALENRCVRRTVHLPGRPSPGGDLA